ncbi:XRE family transcriptional regulator [Comamonas suwonensis]|uniref:Helix-turn-helix domain-containing protein n=1 Tax=Comamonas suwonensis TaxID=2606214 RepID=A0A843BA57_9BURK|nr:S24 family peptidase [Comamonas suwonensis]MBI1626022.1 helix-turn-helix domain-containing protein [Comamonas suwonensis]
MEKDNFPSRLREERERLGLNQEALAEAGGVKKLAQHKYEKGENSPTVAYLQAVAAAGVDVVYALTGVRESVGASPLAGKHALSGSAPAPASNEDTIYVPLLSATGSMGPGNELMTEDVILNDVPFSRRWLATHLPRCRPAAIKLIHAYGDSMHGTLESGDFALVDTDVIEVLIDGVYVLEAHSRLFIKRVRQRLDGRFEVSSDNEAIKTSDILDGSEQICIKGRVVYGWNGRRF